MTDAQVASAQMTNARRGAIVGGIALAVLSVFISFGASLVGAVAIWFAWFVARKRNQPLTRGSAWVIATGAVGSVLLAIFVFLVATRVPRSELTNFKRTMDSVAAAPQKPPPEWLRKMTPPNAQQPLVDSLTRSGAFTIWTLVIGVTFFAGLVGAYAGTLGWLVSMLLAYGATGAWLPRGMTDPSLLSAPPLPPRGTNRPPPA